jgi:hypothetical protein
MGLHEQVTRHVLDFLNNLPVVLLELGFGSSEGVEISVTTSAPR